MCGSVSGSPGGSPVGPPLQSVQQQENRKGDIEREATVGMGELLKLKVLHFIVEQMKTVIGIK